MNKLLAGIFCCVLVGLTWFTISSDRARDRSIEALSAKIAQVEAVQNQLRSNLASAISDLAASATAARALGKRVDEFESFRAGMSASQSKWGATLAGFERATVENSIETRKRLDALDGWRFATSPLIDIIKVNGAQIEQIDHRLTVVENVLKVAKP